MSDDELTDYDLHVNSYENGCPKIATFSVMTDAQAIELANKIIDDWEAVMEDLTYRWYLYPQDGTEREIFE